MATIENFLLKFKVEGQAALNNASNSVKGLGSQVATLAGGLGGLASGVGVVGGAFVALGMKAITLADEISDISDATGISAGALLNFKQSLIEAGGKAEDFSTLAAKLNQNIGDAAEGSDKAQKAFRNLGVYVTDAGGNVRDTEVILRDAIARIAAIEDPSKRAAAAVDLFGKSANKLDFTKLTAMRDPVMDADIKRLAEYQSAIDKIRNTLETKLISFFGGVALEIDKSSQKMAELEKQANARGNTTKYSGYGPGPLSGINPFGIGAPAGERVMTAQEKEALRISQMDRLMAPALGKPRGRTQEAIDAAASSGKGGYGAESDAMRKRRMEIEATSGAYKLQNSLLLDNINFEKGMIGKTDEYVQVEKAREEVLKRAAAESFKLQEAKKALGKDEGALASVYDQQIAKIHEVAKADADRIANATQGLMNLKTLEKSRLSLVDELRKQQEKAADLEFAGSKKGKSPLEQQVMDIRETARKSAEEAKKSFTEIFSGQDMADPAVFLAWTDGLEKIKQGYQELADKQIEGMGVSKEFATAGIDALQSLQDEIRGGMTEAWDEYKSKANDTSGQIKNSFATFTSGMEDALVRFVQTGKLSFADLANSIIADLVRIAVRKAIVFAMTGGTGSLFGFANGGPVMGGQPVIVGERGPELFVPAAAGKIVNNATLNGGGNSGNGSGGSQTIVNYNIQAVDASSFRSLVAKDPSFIYAVTEQGRRSQPTRGIR